MLMTELTMSSTNYLIADLPDTERPRERMQRLGRMPQP